MEQCKDWYWVLLVREDLHIGMGIFLISRASCENLHTGIGNYVILYRVEEWDGGAFAAVREHLYLLHRPPGLDHVRTPITLLLGLLNL